MIEDIDMTEREEYTVNKDETCILFLHIIERAILDCKNLQNSKIPIEQEWFETAKLFLFDSDYRIPWGIYELSLKDILAYLDVDDEWFERKVKQSLNRKKRNM